MDIAPITQIGPLIRPEAVGAPKPAEETTAGAVKFSDLLKQVVEAEAAADTASREYAQGKNQNLHETMLTLQKADISLRLAVNVRNKLMEAYQTVMRMS